MTRPASHTSLLLVCILAVESAAQERGTILRATVADASTGILLTDAQVSVRGLGLSARTDILGDAWITGVPAGTHTVETRLLGYAPLRTQARFSGKDTLEVTLMLMASSQRLPTVTVTDSVSPWLREFEARRLLGKGRYIGETEIRAAHGRSFQSLLEQKFLGIKVLPPPAGFGTRVFSTRGPNNIHGAGCQVAVFYNGVRVDGGTIDNVSLELLGGIEYYAPGYVPVQYREVSVRDRRGGTPSASAACGVMLLWAGG